MKLVLAMIVLSAAVTATALPARATAASALHANSARTAVPAPQQVDDHDDSRVGVQLAVLGAAAFVVVGVGGAGYLLRKRLGRVPPPPEQPPGGHH